MATTSELRRREIEGLRRLLDRCDDRQRGTVSRLEELYATAEPDTILDGLDELIRDLKR